MKALNRAVDLGLNFIDTALAYGEGHSERLVGKLVEERDETIHVATKVPPKNRVWPAPEGIPPEEAFPGDYVRECTEQSLSNLGLDTIDVQQFHVWQDDWVGKGDWLGGGRGPQKGRQDPRFRRLHKRPPGVERGEAHRDRRRRYGAGDLQRLRPEPGGQAPSSLPGARHRRHSQGTFRRGLLDG